MIRWCSFCQAFLGESEPYDDARFSHGMCPSCTERYEHDGAKLLEETSTPRALIAMLLERSHTGDESACVSLIERARAAGLDNASILVGLLQPVLYRTGEAWLRGEVTVADEHRVTAWVERAFSLLKTPHVPRHQADFLLLLGPGNTHTLGPRFATELLVGRGYTAETIFPTLPEQDVVEQIEALQPSVVGVSCALPASIPDAQSFIDGLRARATHQCKYALGGRAFRIAPHTWRDDPRVAVTLDELVARLGT